MTPLEFCQQAMADYEQQWTAAAGHQERHPLRVKMNLLDELTKRAEDPEAFTRELAAGCEGDDPFLAILCDELLPRWQLASKVSGER